MQHLYKLLWRKGKARAADQVPDPAEYLRELEHFYAMSNMPEEEQREWLGIISSENYHDKQMLMRGGMSEAGAAQTSMRRLEQTGGARLLATPQAQHLLTDPSLVIWCMLFGLILELFWVHIKYSFGLCNSCRDGAGRLVTLAYWEALERSLWFFVFLILPTALGVCTKSLVLQRYHYQSSYSFSSSWKSLCVSLPESRWEFVLTLFPVAACIYLTQNFADFTSALSVDTVFSFVAQYILERTLAIPGLVLVSIDVSCRVLLAYVYADIINRVLHTKLVITMTQKMLVPLFRRYHRAQRPPHGE